MLRSGLAYAFLALAAVPFAVAAGCGEDNKSAVPVGASDAAASDPDSGRPITVLPLQDAGAVRCLPVSSLAPAVPAAPLAGTVGGLPFPAAPKSYARPIGSLPGFYEIDISEGEASCRNADGGTRGVRLVVLADGTRCASNDPARAEFYRKTAKAYARPAATEGVLTAKPVGSQLEVGVVVGAFGDPELPSDGLTGTTKVNICP